MSDDGAGLEHEDSRCGWTGRCRRQAPQVDAYGPTHHEAARPGVRRG